MPTEAKHTTHKDSEKRSTMNIFMTQLKLVKRL